VRRPLLFLALASIFSTAPAQAAELPSDPQPRPEAPVKLKPKAEPREKGGSDASLLAPDTDVIDAPTTAVLDYGGYATRSRFFARGGILQYVNFGIFQNLNLGASLTMDGIVGNDRTVRVRAPNVQVKYRFYDGDRYIPSFAVGFDGQGWNYSSTEKRYNNRQRGFYVVGSQELGVPGLMIHPSMNISDFDTNAFFGSIPLTYNILDKVQPMVEWDNINNFNDSRFNAGLRGYLTPHFAIDFAVRGIGQGGNFPNGDSRGPERIVQLRYSNNF
jgi:hypothetical protein